MHGTLCFAQRDTRVPVRAFLDFPEAGETIDDIPAVCPAIPKLAWRLFVQLPDCFGAKMVRPV